MRTHRQTERREDEPVRKNDPDAPSSLESGRFVIHRETFTLEDMAFAEMEEIKRIESGSLCFWTVIERAVVIWKKYTAIQWMPLDENKHCCLQRRSSSRKVLVDVDENDTAEDIKLKVYNLTGIPARQQGITHLGRALENGIPLKQYDVRRTCDVRLEIHMKNGGKIYSDVTLSFSSDDGEFPAKNSFPTKPDSYSTKFPFEDSAGVVGSPDDRKFDANRVMDSTEERGLLESFEDRTCDMEHILFKVYAQTRTNPNRPHVCVEGMCQKDGSSSFDPEAHRVEIESFSHLYVCCQSGIPHACGERCETTFLNSDSSYTCELTGLVREGQMTKGQYWQDPEYRSSSGPSGPNPLIRRKWGNCNNTADCFRELMDPMTLLESSEMLSGDRIDTRILFKTNKSQKPHEAKHLYFTVAFLRMLCIFSDDRFIDDVVQNGKARTETTGLLDKYLSRCEQHDVVGNAADMCTIATTKRLRTCLNPEVNLDSNQRKCLAAHYANKCMALWFVIMTKTKAGIQHPQKFQFDEFITSVIHLLGTGYEIPEERLGYRATIIPPDPFIKSFPITSWVESELHGGYLSTKKRNKSMTRAQKHIEDALYSAVIDDRLSPEELRIDDLKYSDLDANIFVQNKRRKT